MREIPTSLLEGFCVALAPYLPGITPGKVRPLLNSIKAGLSITEIAKMKNVTHQTIWLRIKAAGIEPIGKGKDKRINLYDPADIEKIL